MPGGGALDAEPVDLAVVMDIAQPRHVGLAGIAVVDQRMRPRLAETRAEGGEFGGGKGLLAEHQHRVPGEGLLYPGEGVVVEPREVNTKRFRAESLPQRAEFEGVDHRRPPML